MKIRKGKYRLENRNLNFDIVDDLNFNNSGDCFYFRGGNGFGKTSFLEKIIIPAFKTDNLSYLYIGQDIRTQLYTLKALLSIQGLSQAIDLQANGAFSEAAHNYHQVVQSGMKHSALYFNLGLLWKELGQFNQALEMLNVAARDKQYHLSAQFALGEIYHANGKVDSALKCFVDVVKAVDLQIASGSTAHEIAQRYDGLVNDFLGQGDVKINLFICRFCSCLWKIYYNTIIYIYS